MFGPVRLPFGWWLCRDTTVPADYPPRIREVMIERRKRDMALSTALASIERLAGAALRSEDTRSERIREI